MRQCVATPMLESTQPVQVELAQTPSMALDQTERFQGMSEPGRPNTDDFGTL